MTHLVEAFFATGNELHPPSLDEALGLVVQNWQHDIATGDRVGFLPRIVRGRLFWYGFAPTARRRRELLGLLDAWVGPTYSDLAQGRGALNLDDPFDVTLAKLSCQPIRFEVLPRAVPGSILAKQKVREALINLSALLKRRPLSEFDASRTTVEVLDDLGHAISAQDRNLALTCLRELEATADLDESNLAFLRLRVNAGFQDWAALLADQALGHVLLMRRPLGVTRIIQRAIYHARFAAIDREGGEAELRRASDELPQQFFDLASGAPTTSRAEVVVEFLIALHRSNLPTDPTLTRLLLEAGHLEPGLDAHLQRVLASGAEPPPHIDVATPAKHEPHQTSASARVVTVDEQLADLWVSGEYGAAIDFGCQLSPSLSVARTLLSSARYMQNAESGAMVEEYLTRHGLKSAVSAGGAAFRHDLAWLEAFCTPGTTAGWRAWLEGLGQTDHGSATDAPPYEVAAEWAPLEPSEFTALLLHADEAILGRLGDCGGQFMAAHRDLFESIGAGTIIERVLAGFALSHNSSPGVRVQTLAMLDTLSQASPTTAVFASILEWTAEIVDCCASATSASWSVDVLQAATVAPAQDSLSVMQTFFYRIVHALRPFRTALDLPDLAALDLLAEELAVAVPDDLVAARSGTGADPAVPYRYLRDHKVVLYSLTESAIIRAAQVLRKMVPGISVRTNSEHDGSSQLAALSTNADTFVVVTASAKHAATDFIAEHRGHRPTIFVNSRGSSAILRELARA